jgi:HD-GYP domain-containing protein (c-di-GMP phosphodiesterase class II)
MSMLQTSASFRNDLPERDNSISLSEIISALSYALDLTEGAVHGHALRSCLLGMRIAAEAKLPGDQISSLYFALLLKDVGCSSNATRMGQIVGSDDRAVKAGVEYEDWSKPHKPSLSRVKLFWNDVLPGSNAGARAARSLQIGTAQHSNEAKIDLRCGRGASILNKLGMGEAAAEAVRSVDKHWDGSGDPDRVQREQIPLLARICAVAQHLDVFCSGRGVDYAIETLKERSGTWFDPQLVRVAVSLHRRGALWANCLPSDSHDDTRRAVLDLDAGSKHQLEAGRIDRICEAFADVVDAKSNFTFRHSMGVADAAFGIATALRLPADRAQLVRRTALLHDIGKLSVPNIVLDKKGKLSDREWETVHLHPGITRSILERVAPFREMAVIAGEHHEKLDGSGYPSRLMAPDLSLESRIIAVADVYAALSEDRPYRAALDFDEIVSIMAKLVPDKLDADCFYGLVCTISSRSGVAMQPAIDLNHAMAAMNATNAANSVLAFA